MSRNTENEPKAESADLPDDTAIQAGANYEIDDPCRPLNPQPGFRYFAAAADGDNSRPDGVARVKAMGYEVCTEEKCMSTDCKLMRIPLDVWTARNNKKILAARKAALTEGNNIQGVPEEDTWKSADHSRIRKVK